MLLRLRWQLLEADYSVALMLLLKYPYPDPPHGPQTFIEDALMLRKNLNTSTGTKIITKYSGRPPNDSTPGSFPPTPNYTSTADRRIRRRRSPLPSPSTFIRQQGGVEAILQGAAKGVFERSERLGINQIMRDGFGELKKNMQGLPSPALSRRTSENGKWKIDDRRPSTSAVKALQALEARNRKLGELLGEVADDLYKLAEAPGAQDQSAEAVSVAIRRMSLLRGCLNDSSQPIPSFTPATSSPTVASTAVPSTQLSTASTMVVEPEFDTNEQLQDPNSFDLGDFDNDDDTPLSPVTPQATPHVTPHVRNARKPSFTPTPMASSKPQTQADSPSSPPKEEPPSTETHAQPRPQTIIPTRSSLAQSSFAWMLEPGDSLSPSKSAAFSSPSASSGRKPTPRHAREKSAFLFGDDEGVDASKSGGADPLQAFSLDEMKK